MDAQTILESLNEEKNIKIFNRSGESKDHIKGLDDWGEPTYSPLEYTDSYFSSTILDLPIKTVEVKGGEDRGSYYHIVIEVSGFFFKIVGEYNSWDGTYFYEPWSQVFPKEVVSIEYV